MKNCTYVLRTVLLFCVFATAVMPGFSQQIQKGLTSSTGDYLGFLEYKPVDYDNTTTTYPLIIFLHGIGERGNGTTMLNDVTCCGIPRMIRLGHKMTFTWNGKTETFIVISPQCPEKYGMWPSVFITELINYAKTNLRVDPNRIYLTGLSMGGGGTYRYISTAAEQPKNLAAAATICAPCTFSNPVYAVDAKLPVWSFHALNDSVALAYCSQQAVKRLNDLNANPKPLLTLWPTGGHVVWDRVYTDTAYKFDGVVNIYEWFLGQNKSWPVNIMPVARAGNAINITTATATATLDASTSTDADGKLVRYVWKKISGPVAGKITTPFGPASSTTVTGLTIAGTYEYELNVVDNRAAVSRDTLKIVVSDGGAVNVAPVAKAGSDATITLPVNSFNLNGSSSTDQDGTISTYLWTKISGPAATIVNPAAATTSVTSFVAGTYIFKLKVTDDKGAFSEDQVTIVVNPAVNTAPVANAGADITITLPTNTVTLDGTKSIDSNGIIASYLWTKVSGPAATIASTTSSKTTANGLIAGTYIFKLKVTDNGGVSSEDQVTVIVNPEPNITPVANAGHDITITLPTNTVTLDGTKSVDSNGTISSFLWTKVSGPTATITNASGSTTAINGLVEGTYIFKLKVTDNSGASSEDQVTVKVNPAPNVAPVAKAGADVTITLPVNSVALNGTTSSDADGTIMEYLWTKVSGPDANIGNPTGSSTTVNGLAEGSYVFKLKVTDDDGASAEDQVTVIVNPAPNVAPVAKAGADITITLPVNTVTLNGSSSTDEDGTIATWLWSKVSGPAATIANISGSTTSVNNLVEGTYIFKLKITDNSGASSEDQVTVKVNPAPNVAPVAKAGADITLTLPVNTATLNGSSSTDSDGTITTYLWSKVSGPAATIANTSSATTVINNLVEGSYIFKLRVTDNSGASAEDQVIVKVNPAPNVLPDAKAGSDITITLPENKTVLNGSSSSDVDGSIVSYTWAKISGPSQFIIGNTSAISTNISNLVEGTYTFRLLVTDNNGANDADTILVKVNPAPPPPNIAPVAQAGANQTITLPVDNLSLDGSASTDEDGTITSYNWTYISGPASYTINGGTTSVASVTELVEGTYSFRLEVMDDDGALDADTISIIVEEAAAPPPPPNIAPSAEAGNDYIITLPMNEVTLDGTGSTDADGTITSYKWSKVSGPVSFNIKSINSATTKVENLVEGTYVFQLQVKDNNGALGNDVVTITVLPAPNEIPASDAGPDMQIQLPDASVQLNGTDSYDPDGTVNTYKWEQVSGPSLSTISNTTSAITDVTALEEGEYVFRLTVTDNDGARASDVVKITVLAANPNTIPVPDAGNDIEVKLPVGDIQLDGSNSNDPDGSITTYNWVQVSGPEGITITNSTGSATGIVGLTEGEYVFRLTVTDNEGAQASDDVKITVLPAAPNVLPVANAGNDIEVTLPDTDINLDGSNSNDPDGSISTYTWVKVSGPGGVTITNSAGPNPGIVGLAEGEYVFRLTVTDNDDTEASDDVKVTVHAAIPPPVNTDPVADAGDDQTINLPDSSLTISGVNSKDEDGTIANYTWTMVEGPTTAAIVNPSSPSTIINNLTTGEYTFELTVVDNDGAVSRDTVNVSVINTQRYEGEFLVYPNPAKSNIKMRLTSDTTGLTRITIYNSNGVIIKSIDANKTQPELSKTINISNLQTGLYYLEVIIAGKERRITRFIKQ